MIVFNLAEGLESYVGLEPAETAAAFVTKMVKTTPRLADKVEIHVGTAADISMLPRLKFPTTVVHRTAGAPMAWPQRICVLPGR